MSTEPFYNSDDYSYCRLLQDSTEIILKELNNIIHNEASNFPLNAQWLAAHPNYVKGSINKSWKTFEFVFFGIEKSSNIQLCPNTYKIIKQIPELITAQFSVLYPHTHVEAHKGYSRIITRNHLPLIVPESNDLGIQVGNEIRKWKKGELLIFDDSVEHSAWNNTDEIRAVLMFDVAKKGCGYSADEICRYKLERVDDPFLLNIADKSTWLKWYDQGYFDESENH